MSDVISLWPIPTYYHCNHQNKYRQCPSRRRIVILQIWKVSCLKQSRRQTLSHHLDVIRSTDISP